MIVILGSGVALALLVAHRISQRLTAPLTHLEVAAQAVGRGQTPALPAQIGVSELDGLSREFNQMAKQVANRRTLAPPCWQACRTICAALSPVCAWRSSSRTHPQTGRFDDMERYLEQMEQMISDFIDYSRGTSQRPLTPLALAPWLARLAAEHHAEYLGCDVPTVHTNTPALERILANLLENAQRYAPDGVPQLRCTQDEEAIHIDVLDRGPGIPAAELEHVFDPFYRIDNARNSGGSGLGLSIVREICRAHAWHIQLSNRDGGGLQARLSLPEPL